MAGFLYFVPGVSGGDWDVPRLRQLGLGQLADEVDFQAKTPISHCGTTAGPGGAGGTLVAIGRRPLGYYPDRQTWRKIPGRPEESPLWVGYQNDAPPGPEDLRRRDTFPGLPVRLGDGREWLCPMGVAWNFDDDPPTWQTTVARSLDWNDAGELVEGDVIPAHRQLWEATERMWNFRMGASVDGERVTADITFVEAAELFAECLGFNYRVGLGEIGLLGLLNQTTLMPVLNVLIDWQSFLEWSEKKTSNRLASLDPLAGSTTEPGSPESCPATDPPSSTSGSPANS